MARVWYQDSKREALEALKSSEEGLTEEQAAALLQEVGKNELQAAPRKSKLAIFLSQFKDLMILILIGAALISFFMGERVDAYVIFAIILGNAYIGFS
jgi:Ca2+-transporting ATPase